VFVTKLNPAGTGLVYSTFLGGYGVAYATAIAVDAVGRAYIAGNTTIYCSVYYTFQSCFPTTGGAVIAGSQPGGRSAQNSFVAAFDPTGAHLLYSTLFGDLNQACPAGCGATWATGVAVDANGYFYLVGETQAARLPTTAGVVQPNGAPLDSTGVYVLGARGFIAKFTPVTSGGGAAQAYCTYLGGQTASLNDYISGIAIDSASNAYVVGYTNSKDFPVTQGAYSTVCGPNGQNCAAAHVTKLNPYATSIIWSTFVGDAKPDASDAVFFTGPIQLDGAGNVYIIGQTGGAPGFPMVNPVEPTPTGGFDQVLVAELDPTGSHLLFSTTIGSHGLNTASPAGLAVDTSGDIFLAGNNDGPDLFTTPGAFQTTSGDGVCCQKGNGFVAKISPTNPQITAVTDAAGYQQGISPGAWIVIWGANLSSTTRSWLTSEIINGKLPTQLDGVGVTVDGKPAAVYYISPGQLDVQAPDDSTTGSVQVVVTAPQGTATATATMQTVSPGLFMYNTANRNYIAAQHVDYSLVGPSAPAKPGEVVILYATGFGPTTPPTPSGQLVTTAWPDLSAITLTIGGSPAQVPLWTGITEAGLWQMNVQVPQGASSGDAAVVAQIGGKSTQSNVFLSIQTP
jgi:uncharacterized protein (TIGR03437 family)